MPTIVTKRIAIVGEDGRLPDSTTPAQVFAILTQMQQILDGIEAHLQEMLAKSANLSDIPSPAAARQNLGAAPIVHTHQQGDIIGLVDVLGAKADLVNGVIPTSQIPREAMGDPVVVEDEAEMLALTAEQVQPGDIAIRQDGAGTFILRDADPSVLGSWVRLNSPTDAVTSVNGQIGDVTLGAADVGAVSPDQLSTAINGVQIKADGFAELAAGSAAAASGSATAAAGSALLAGQARTGAETARSGAEAALAAVPAAVTDQVTSQVAPQISAATTAREDAEAARNIAVQAKTDAETARNQAQQAAADTLNLLPEFDPVAGEYTPSAIVNWLNRKRDWKIYGVRIPKDATVACAKTGDNAGIANPVPGIAGAPGTDPYKNLGPFFYSEVNGYVDVNGVPHVTAFKDDATFSRTGANGDVWILAPNLYYRFVDDGDAMVLSICDVRRPGFVEQPKGKLPTQVRRPYMLYAKYALSIVDGTARSISNQPPANYNVSHNSLITQCKNATTGYSGKSLADDWYAKAMFLLKYASKNSQSVFAGCTNHSQQYAPAVAESNVTRVLVTTAQAAQYPIGSAVMLGSNVPPSTDRAAAQLYNVISTAKIIGKEVVGANTALLLNVSVPVSTATSQLLSTAPWWTGGCDGVVGDGSPTSNSSGREPFVLQGIEIGIGLNEILGDVILNNTGSGFKIFTLLDSKKAATSVTADYVDTGKSLFTDASDGWKYPIYSDSAGGLLFGAGSGGSSTTGMCDGSYTNALATTGVRTWQALGNLISGGGAGLWFVSGSLGLTITGWYLGSRLSANGRAG